MQALSSGVKTNVGLHSHVFVSLPSFPVPFLPLKVPQAKHFVFLSIIEFKKGQLQVLSVLLKAKVQLHSHVFVVVLLTLPVAQLAIVPHWKQTLLLIIESAGQMQVLLDKSKVKVGLQLQIALLSGLTPPSLFFNEPQLKHSPLLMMQLLLGHSHLLVLGLNMNVALHQHNFLFVLLTKPEP